MPEADSGLSALVVDDDPQVRLIVTYVLKKHGYIVVTAESGEGGLKELESRSFTFVVTDLRMAGMSGADFILELRSRGMAIPVLIISSSLSDVSADTMARLGRIESLEKPFRPEALIQAVERLLGPRPPKAKA